MGMKKTGTKRMGENYHLTAKHLVAENDTERVLDADGVWELYLSVDSSLTKFIALMGYPETGYGRRVANQVFDRYQLQPKQHQKMQLASISYEEAYQAYQGSSSFTEIGWKLGAQSEARAYTVGKQIVEKWNFDTSVLQWQVTNVADVISREDALQMLEQSTALRELGQLVRDRTGSKSDRIYLARKVIGLYNLDDTKFQQCPIVGMTRDEILDIYMSSDYKDEFMKRLGYARGDKFASIVYMFGLPERDWEYRKPKPRRRTRTSRKAKPRNHPNKTTRKPYSRRPIESCVPTRERLIQVRGHACEACGRTIWKGHHIPLEMHHINGNHRDNRWDNVQLLCCNCHNKASLDQAHQRTGCVHIVSDEELIEALQSNETIAGALRAAHMSISKHGYSRCHALIVQFHISPYYDEMMEGMVE